VHDWYTVLSEVIMYPQFWVIDICSDCQAWRYLGSFIRITVATKGHGVMATLDQDSSDTAGRLLRTQDLETLTDVLGDVEYKWRAIGAALGLTQHNLETLEISSTVSPLSDVLKLWLQNQKQPTVEHLIIVLQDIGERTTDHRIGKKFLNQRGKCPCAIYIEQ